MRYVFLLLALLVLIQGCGNVSANYPKHAKDNNVTRQKFQGEIFVREDYRILKSKKSSWFNTEAFYRSREKKLTRVKNLGGPAYMIDDAKQIHRAIYKLEYQLVSEIENGASSFAVLGLIVDKNKVIEFRNVGIINLKLQNPVTGEEAEVHDKGILAKRIKNGDPLTSMVQDTRKGAVRLSMKNQDIDSYKDGNNPIRVAVRLDPKYHGWILLGVDVQQIDDLAHALDERR